MILKNSCDTKRQLVDRSFQCQVFLTFFQVFIIHEAEFWSASQKHNFLYKYDHVPSMATLKYMQWVTFLKCYTEQARTVLYHQIGKILH